MRQHTLQPTPLEKFFRGTWMSQNMFISTARVFMGTLISHLRRGEGLNPVGFWCLRRHLSPLILRPPRPITRATLLATTDSNRFVMQILPCAQAAIQLTGVYPTQNDTLESRALSALCRVYVGSLPYDVQQDVIQKVCDSQRTKCPDLLQDSRKHAFLRGYSDLVWLGRFGQLTSSSIS